MRKRWMRNKVCQIYKNTKYKGPFGLFYLELGLGLGLDLELEQGLKEIQESACPTDFFIQCLFSSKIDSICC